MHLTGSTMDFVAADWSSQIVVSSDHPVFLTHQNTSHFCSFILQTDLQECTSILLQLGSIQWVCIRIYPLESYFSRYRKVLCSLTQPRGKSWKSLQEELPRSPHPHFSFQHELVAVKERKVRKETRQSLVLWKQWPEQFSSQMGGLQNINCGALAHWFHNP